jgi:hypothetical protein
MTRIPFRRGEACTILSECSRSSVSGESDERCEASGIGAMRNSSSGGNSASSLVTMGSMGLVRSSTVERSSADFRAIMLNQKLGRVNRWHDFSAQEN